MTRRELLLAGGAATLAWAGCRPEDPPAPPSPVTPPPVAPPVPAPATVWTADTVSALVPAAPRRTTAISSPVPPLPAYDAALAILGAVVDRYAGDIGNPWAVAHGVLARGPEFRLRDGREAVATTFASWAELHEVGGRPLVGFPRELGKVRVEPHADLLLKNLGEVGVPVDATFTVGGRSVTMADLYRYTLVKTFLVAKDNHASFASPNDTPWTLQALAQWAPAAELQWIALDGTPMDLDDLTGFVCAVLSQESGALFARMRRDEPLQKDGKGIFAYTCGGAHLLQGAAYAVARGFGSDKDRKVVEAQVPLWFWRLPRELAAYDEASQHSPGAEVRLLSQRMKFLGHFLETLAKLQAMGLYTASADQSTALEGAAQNLTLTVQRLDKKGAFAGLDALRTEDEQLYLDLVGDAAHAVRGLELALGRQTVSW